MAVIAIDFDGTLVSGDIAFPGAKEAINQLREAGHKIIIHSCNATPWVERVLMNNDIRYDYLWDSDSLDHGHKAGGKPIADLYIDDKGYHFRGSWSHEMPDILIRLAGLDNRKW